MDTNKNGLADPQTDSLKHWQDYLVSKYTKTIFGVVVQWAYIGGDQPWKTTLFEDAGYNINQYERDFSPCERDALENNKPVNELNAHLLYKLLHSFCDLSVDPIEWAIEKSEDSSLENLLYKIMKNFNESSGNGTKGEMINSNLENTHKIFKDALTQIGKIYILSENNIEQVVSEMEKDFNIVSQKIGTTLSVEDVENFTNIRNEYSSHNSQIQNEVQQSIKDELFEYYTPLKKHNNVVNFENNNKVDVNETTSKIILKTSSKFLSPLDQSGRYREVEKEVSIDQIFHIKTDDGTIPKLITMQGIDGIGKSRLLQNITSNWMEDPSEIKRLHGFDALVFIQSIDLRSDKISQLIASRFKKTQHKFAINTRKLEDILLCMNLLFVVCDYDMNNEISKNLIAEILELPGQIRVVCEISTLDENVDKLFPENVSQVNLHVQCLMSKDRLSFIDRTIELLCDSQKDIEEIKYSLTRYLQLISPKLHSILHIPLLLKQLTMLWLDSQEHVRDSITMTEILIEVNKMIMNNLTKQLEQNIVNNEISLQSRLEVLNKHLTELALFSWLREENTIDNESVVKLNDKCSELEITNNEFLCAYLNPKDYILKNEPLQTFAFQNRLIHAFHSACYLVRLILENSILENNNEEQKEYKSIIKEFLKNVHNKQEILMFLTGILNSSNKSLLKESCYDIIELTNCHVSEEGCLEVDKMLSNIAESVNDLDFTRAVAFRLDEIYRYNRGCNEWRISNPNVLCTLPSLLDFTYPVDHGLNIRGFASKMPSHLCLDLIDPPSSAILKTALIAISEREINLNVNFLCQYNPGGELSDVFLETLNRSNNKCILTTFLGRLSDTAVQWLPKTLETLCLRIDFNGLTSLTQHLSSLNNLSSLDILVDGLTRNEMNHVKPLPYCGAHLWLRLELTDLSDEDLDSEWVSQIVKQIWPQQRDGKYSMCGIYGTKLTGIGCEHVLRSFQGTGITTDIVVFGTSAIISEESSNDLSVLAAQLGCGRVLIES